MVAALLRVAGITAGLAESNSSLPPGLYNSRHLQADCQELELGRYRFFKSVSVFVFLVGFQKSVSVSVSVFQNIAISVSVFPHEPTIAYRITPSLTPYALPFPPNGVWALELQIAAIRDSDIVTINNL